MKQISVTISFLLLLMIHNGGCYIDPGEPDNDTGTIRIHLSLQQGRDLGSEDSETASGLSDMYEIIVYNESDQISSVLSPESTMSTITASAGRYTVVVAAGFTHSGQVVLLGSGIQENVDVVSNSITEVSITLIPVTHRLSVPDTATCMSEYTVDIFGDTHNSVLNTSINGTTMDNRPYIEIGDSSDNIYLECTESGSSWNGTVICTAPNIAGLSNIRFFGSCIRLTDLEYGIDINLNEITAHNWTWINYTACEPGELIGETERVIEFTAPDTGMSVIIGWI